MYVLVQTLLMVSRISHNQNQHVQIQDINLHNVDLILKPCSQKLVVIRRYGLTQNLNATGSQPLVLKMSVKKNRCILGIQQNVDPMVIKVTIRLKDLTGFWILG